MSRAPAEVMCVGEAMVCLVGPDLSEGASLVIHQAGAESNVAMAVVASGVAAEWFSRVGDDCFGRFVLDGLTARGVEVGATIIDGEASTGVMVKHPGPGPRRVAYCRAGSAASHLGLADVPALRIETRAVVHVSGVTAALSESCLAFTQGVAADCRAAGVGFSFDVNYRPSLWADQETARRVLRSLAAASTVCFVGRDECQALWGVQELADVRAILGPVPTLVLKDGPGPVVLQRPGAPAGASVQAVPNPVRVHDAVGAGDAFAGGFLAAWVSGADDLSCLRAGNARAREVLTVEGDVAPLRRSPSGSSDEEVSS